MIDQPIPNELAADAPRTEKNAYSKHKEDSLDVTCIMLATMDPKLQMPMEDIEAYDMIIHLKEMFQEQARHERFVVAKELNSCEMAPSGSVSAHVLKMKSYIDRIDKLSTPISKELATDLILASLPPSLPAMINL